MTELTSGIFNVVAQSTLIRAIIYTIGHILIAITCNVILTGAAPNLAVLDALVEPVINGFWYYLLDYVFVRRVQ